MSVNFSKALLCIFGLILTISVNAQDIKTVKTVFLKVKVNSAAEVTLPESFADSVKKAELILSRILSSDDFKQALIKRTFADSSFSKSKKNCFELKYNADGRVSGEGVYENLTRNQQINIEWVIKNYPNGKTKTMGFSSACIDKITSYDYWIKDGQYLSLRIVRHLAHEFTHVCGYRHSTKVAKGYKWDNKNDPAYGVGGIAGDIMLDWAKKGLL